MTTLNPNVATFGQRSDGYANSRPSYPEPLFDWIVSQCKEHHAAWDCATGNGQAARSLATRFDRVCATDLSKEQIAQGFDAPNISYSAAAAEDSGFEDNTFDLVTVAQALHWFDFTRFWAEVRRVAKPGAFFCAWAYVWPEIDSSIANQVLEPIKDLVDPFWAEGNRIIMRGYQPDEIQFPFEPLKAPAFSIEVDWTYEQFVAFIETWSAYKIAVAEPDTGAKIGKIIQAATSRYAGSSFEVSMPIQIVAAAIK